MSKFRTPVYIPRDLFLRFKAQLAARGLSFSEWVRRKVQEEVEKND